MATSSENSNCEIENLNTVPQEIQQSSCQLTGNENPVEHSHQKPSNEAEEKAPTIPEVAEEEEEEEEEGREATEKRKRQEENEEEENADDEKGVLHPMWKTSLCSYYRRQSGSCSHGDGCRYAHGEAELLPRRDNTWDPTSERAKKLLKSENGGKIETLEEEEAREDVLATDDVADSSDCSLRKCLVDLPRRWNSDNLRSFLDEQGVLYKTANKKKGMTVGFVTFETLEEVKNAIEGLNGKSMGNKHIKVADVIPRSFEKKAQTIEQSEEAELADDFVINSTASKSRSARDVVTPLAHLRYSDQLENKKKSLEQSLKRLTRNARKACPDAVPLPEWILKSKEIGGLPCRLEGIVESPLVDGYRNKCEFSVGFSTQGKITVGFMVGNFREGVTAVGEPIDCPNVSKIACKYAYIFQEFLQQSSLPVWNRVNNTGYWRQLTVREGRSPSQAIDIENVESNISEVMLMVQVCSLGCDDELTKSELQRMSEDFVEGANANSPPLPLTSLVVQDHQGISNAAPADAPLHPLPIPKAESAPGQDGENNSREVRIHDYISNLQFSISPTAFFQVNTLAAEKLYSLAGDWAGLGPDTLLFDICCGTGTIGLTLAHRVGMVIGIEMNASAVSDAQRNAEINGIKNCKFVCAKAEEVVGSLLKEYHSLTSNQEETPHVSQSSGKWETEEENGVSSRRLDLDNLTAESVKSVPGSENIVEELKDPSEKSCISEEKNGKIDGPSLQYKNVVAIVDPPRVGLHPIVIKALRTHSSLRRLVYISCNPDSLVANAIELCTPSSDKTEKGNKNNRGWRNMSSAGLARHRAKSMPNSEPFRPVKAMAVDLFPHTPHCEMVMLLERSVLSRPAPQAHLEARRTYCASILDRQGALT